MTLANSLHLGWPGGLFSCLIHDGGPVEATTTNDIITLQYYGHVGTRRPLKEICLRPWQPRATAAAW